MGLPELLWGGILVSAQHSVRSLHLVEHRRACAKVLKISSITVCIGRRSFWSRCCQVAGKPGRVQAARRGELTCAAPLHSIPFLSG